MVLFGAVLTATLPYWADRAAIRPTTAGACCMCWKSCCSCTGAATRSRSLQLADLRRRVHTGYDELGHLLDTLARAGYVCRTRRDGWLLTGRAEHIRCVSSPAVHPAAAHRHRHFGTSAGITWCWRPGEAALDISLAGNLPGAAPVPCHPRKLGSEGVYLSEAVRCFPCIHQRQPV